MSEQDIISSTNIYVKGCFEDVRTKESTQRFSIPGASPKILNLIQDCLEVDFNLYTRQEDGRLIVSNYDPTCEFGNKPIYTASEEESEAIAEKAIAGLQHPYGKH